MIRVISTLKVGKNPLVGYRIFVDDAKQIGVISASCSVVFRGKVADLTTLQTLKVLQQYGSVNAFVEEGKVSVTDGSVNSLPVVDPRTNVCLDNNVLIVLSELTYNDEVVGYSVCNYAGITAQLKTSDLLAKHTAFANAKIVTRGGTSFVSAIKGAFASFPLKPKSTNRVVVVDQTNYATLVSTTKKYGSCSIRARAKSKGLLGVVSLSEDGKVVFRTKDTYGDMKTYIIPQSDFNTTFELDTIVLPSNQYQSTSTTVPTTKQTNMQVLQSAMKRGIKSIPVTEVVDGKQTGIKGYVRIHNGLVQFQRILPRGKDIINVSENYVNGSLLFHAIKTQSEQPTQPKQLITR